MPAAPMAEVHGMHWSEEGTEGATIREISIGLYEEHLMA
jgi:hypothetical protein